MITKTIDKFFIEYFHNNGNVVENVRIVDNDYYKTITIKFSDINKKVYNYNIIDGCIYNANITFVPLFSSSNLAEFNDEWLEFIK